MAQRIGLSDYWLETQRIIAVSQGMFPLDDVECPERASCATQRGDTIFNVKSHDRPNLDDLSWEDLRDREFGDEAVYDDGQETEFDNEDDN